MPYLTNDSTRFILRSRGVDPEDPRAIEIAQRWGLPIGDQPDTGLGGDVKATIQGFGRGLINTLGGIVDLPLMAGRAANVTDLKVPYMQPSLTEQVNPVASAVGSLGSFIPTMMLPGAALGGVGKLANVSRAGSFGRAVSAVGRGAQKANQALNSTRTIARMAERGGTRAFTGKGAAGTFSELMSAQGARAGLLAKVERAPLQGRHLFSGLNPTAIGARAVETGVPMGTVGFLQGRTPEERFAGAGQMAAFGAVFGGLGAYPGMGRRLSALREGVIGAVAPPPVETGDPVQDRAAGAIFGSLMGAGMFPRQPELGIQGKAPEQLRMEEVQRQRKQNVRLSRQGGKQFVPLRDLQNRLLGESRLGDEGAQDMVDEALRLVETIENPAAWEAAQTNLSAMSAADQDAYLTRLGLTNDQVETIRRIGRDPDHAAAELANMRDALIKIGLNNVEVDRAIAQLAAVGEARQRVVEAAKRASKDDAQAIEELGIVYQELDTAQEIARTQHARMRAHLDAVKKELEATTGELPPEIVRLEAFVDAEMAKAADRKRAGQAALETAVEEADAVREVSSQSDVNHVEQQDHRIKKGPTAEEEKGPGSDLMAELRAKGLTGKAAEAEEQPQAPAPPRYEDVQKPTQTEQGEAVWSQGAANPNGLGQIVQAMRAYLGRHLDAEVVIHDVRQTENVLEITYDTNAGVGQHQTLRVNPRNVDPGSQLGKVVQLYQFFAKDRANAVAADGEAAFYQRMLHEQGARQQVAQAEELAARVEKTPEVEPGREADEEAVTVEHKPSEEESYTAHTGYRQLMKNIKSHIFTQVLGKVVPSQYFRDRAGHLDKNDWADTVAFNILQSDDARVAKRIKDYLEGSGEHPLQDSYVRALIRDEVTATLLDAPQIRGQVDWSHGSNRAAFSDGLKVIRAFESAFQTAPRLDEFTALMRDNTNQDALRRIAEERGVDFEAIRGHFRRSTKTEASESTPVARLVSVLRRKMTTGELDSFSLEEFKNMSSDQLLAMLQAEDGQLMQAYNLKPEDVQFIRFGAIDSGGRVLGAPKNYPDEPMILEDGRTLTGLNRLWEIVQPDGTASKRAVELDAERPTEEGETTLDLAEVPIEEMQRRARSTVEERFPTDPQSGLGGAAQGKQAAQTTSERAVAAALSGRVDPWGRTALPEAQLAQVAELVRRWGEETGRAPQTADDVISILDNAGINLGDGDPHQVARIAQIMEKLGLEPPREIEGIEVDPNLYVYDDAFRTHEQMASELERVEGIPQEFVEAQRWALERGTKLSAIDRGYRLRVEGMTMPEIEQALFRSGKYSRGEARSAAQIVTASARDQKGRLKSRLPKSVEQVKNDPSAIPEVILQRLATDTKNEAVTRIVEQELQNRPKDPNNTFVDASGTLRMTEETAIERATAKHRKRVKEAERNRKQIERERKKAVEAARREARKQRQALREVRRKLSGRLRKAQTELKRLRNQVESANQAVREAAREGSPQKLKKASERLQEKVEQAERTRDEARALLSLQQSREILFEKKVVEEVEKVDMETRAALESAREAPDPEQAQRYHSAKDFLEAMQYHGKSMAGVPRAKKLLDAMPWRLFVSHIVKRMNDPFTNHPTNRPSIHAMRSQVRRLVERATREKKLDMFQVTRFMDSGPESFDGRVAKLERTLQHLGLDERFRVSAEYEGVAGGPLRVEVLDRATGEATTIKSPEQASMWIDFRLSEGQANLDPPVAVKVLGKYSGNPGAEAIFRNANGPRKPKRDFDLSDGEGGDFVPPRSGRNNPIETIKTEVREETAEQVSQMRKATGEGKHSTIELGRLEAWGGLPLRILDRLEKDFKNMTGETLGLAPLVRHATHQNNLRFRETNKLLDSLDKIRQETGVGLGRKTQMRIGRAARSIDEVAYRIQREQGMEAAKQALPELRAAAARRFGLRDSELQFLVRVQEEFLPSLFRRFDIPAEQVVGFFPRMEQSAHALKRYTRQDVLTNEFSPDVAFTSLNPRRSGEGAATIEEADPLAYLDQKLGETYLELGIPKEEMGENFLQTIGHYVRAGVKNEYVRQPVERIHNRARELGMGADQPNTIFGPAVEDLVGQAINRLIGQREFSSSAAASADKRVKLAKRIVDYAEKIRPYAPERIVRPMQELARSFGINASQGQFKTLMDTYVQAHRGSVFGLHVMRAVRDFTTTNFFFIAPRLQTKDFARAFGEIMFNPKETMRYLKQLRDEGTIPDDMLQGLPALDETGGYIDVGNEFANRAIHRGIQYGPKIMTGLYRKADVLTRAILTKAMDNAVPRELELYRKTTNKQEAFETFMANLGLDTYSTGQIDQYKAFIQRALDTGDVKGLVREISKLHQEGTVFEYSLPAAPRFYDSSLGRFLGQYGTWPLNAMNSMYWAARGPFSHHTSKRRALARSAKIWGQYALTAELVYSLGATMFDIDTSDFIPFVHNFWYTGGPGLGIIDTARDIIGGDPTVHRRLEQDPVQVISDVASDLFPVPASDILLKRIPSQFLSEYTKNNKYGFQFYDLPRARENAWGRALVSMGFTPYSKPLTDYQGNVFVGKATEGPKWVQDRLHEMAPLLAPGTASRARWHDTVFSAD